MIGRLLLGLVLGGAGGLVAFLIQEPLLDHQRALFDPAAAIQQTVWLSVILGACYGFSLGMVDSLTRGLPAQALRKGFVAALIGLPGAMIALFLGNLVYGTLSELLGNPIGAGATPTPLGFVTDIVPRTLGWMFFGTGIGVAVGAVTGSVKRWWHSTVGGAFGGALGGVAFEIFTLIFTPLYLAMSGGGRVEIGAPGRAVGFPVLGASIGFFIALVQEALKAAWVRVVVGRNEGKEYPVDKPVCIIGRDEYADIPLFGDPQIAPQHARILRQQNRHLLEDLATPAGTLLNGQPVQQAWLKDGDTIQIASMRLQFFEKATRSLVREAMERLEKPVSRPALPDYLCPYCGERKHPVTGQCACSVVPGAAAQVAIPSAALPVALQTSSGAAVRPAAGAVATKLVILAGARAGATFALQGDVITIGREPGRDVQIDFDPTVSRRHARLERQGNQWVLIDEGSRNGSFVNGQPVQQQAVQIGDILRFGGTEMRVE
ncbi:MAG: FHA domain-containing protein [Armatimonadota bacterium]|nr:FHA domain-containing protein [bacterium]MDW8321070.1 FHA domain-containing protein [Armatimonadota bacterium]